MINEELWQAVLAQIQFNISKVNFATWFKNTKIISNKDGEIVITTPNSFSKEWLSNKYNDLIFKILKGLDNQMKTVNYIIQPENPKLKSLKHFKKHNIEVSPNQLDFEEFNINSKTNLNPKYDFDNFIVGSFNEVAHAAAWAVAQNPGFTYNPLFIYGGVGLGKTHILQASGNFVAENFPEKKIKYSRTGQFVFDIVRAIRNHEIENLKMELCKIDVLIIDDVQFLAGKEKTQEEFFEIFNALYEVNKQIVISSDRQPKAIPALAERLRSRFEGGMIADISFPDFETRVAILKAKAEQKEINLSNDVLEYVASNIQTNIREMEGALNRLLIYKKLNNKNCDLETTKKLLHNLIVSPSFSTNSKKIIQTVSQFYDLKEGALLDQTRRKEIVKPRQIAMYLLRTELKESFPLIGRKFKDKDHTTVIYACKKIEAEVEKNINLMTEINLIRQRLYAESLKV